MKTDPRVDRYIAKAAPFAQPVLAEVRKRVQQACPEAEETIKWNVPFFMLGGKLLASMAAFKKHLKVGIWTDGKGDFVDVTSVAELPAAKELTQKIRDAAKLVANAVPAAKSSAMKSKKAVAKPTAAKKKTTKKAR